MTKPFIGTKGSAHITIDVPRLLETRLLVQANSGGGKSWTLRRIIEQVADKVQVLVIDPEGEFYTLREKYDFVICAPHDGDAQAHPRTAAMLARRLLETGVSAVLDIYDLKAHERQAFVRIFLDTLVNAPKKLWHPVFVVLDEAHVYAPERGKSESTSAVIDLATRGRKRGMCLIPATQRLSKLHKDVAAECINKLIGRTGLDIDVKRAADELGMSPKEAVRTLRNLEEGEFFVFGPAFTREVTKVRVGNVMTTHPKLGQRLMVAPPAPSAKVKKVLAKLADLPKEAEQEARTMAELKKENTTLKREITVTRNLAKKSGVPEKEVQQRIKVAVQDAKNNNHSVFDRSATSEIKELARRMDVLAKKLTGAGPVTPQMGTKQSPNGHHIVPNESSLRKGALKILAELAARYPAHYTKAQVGTLTGFSSRGGTFNTYISDLYKSGFIEKLAGNSFKATEAGIEFLGERIPAAPTSHEEVMAQWRRSLRAGAYRMLAAIVEAGPEGLSREGIGTQVAMTITGGTFSTYLSDLRRNGLIEERHGVSIACDILFPGK